jgi:hypothetical protein
VFEVPEQRTSEFVGAMQLILEQPPTPDFRVPIKVKPKRGRAFGEMREPEERPAP